MELRTDERGISNLVTSLVTGAGIFRIAASGAGAEVEFDPEVLRLGVSTGLHLDDDGVVLACGNPPDVPSVG